MAQSSASKETGPNGLTGEPSYADLSAQIERLKEDISGLTSTVTELGKLERDRMASAAKAKGDALKASGEAHLDVLEATARGYVREGQTFVREQPATALGVVAALGFLFGFMMSRK